MLDNSCQGVLGCDTVNCARHKGKPTAPNSFHLLLNQETCHSWSWKMLQRGLDWFSVVIEKLIHIQQSELLQIFFENHTTMLVGEW